MYIYFKKNSYVVFNLMKNVFKLISKLKKKKIGSQYCDIGIR